MSVMEVVTGYYSTIELSRADVCMSEESSCFERAEVAIPVHSLNASDIYSWRSQLHILLAITLSRLAVLNGLIMDSKVLIRCWHCHVERYLNGRTVQQSNGSKQ